MQNAPKRKVKCSKTQGKTHQNAGRNVAKRRANAIICSVQKSQKVLQQTETACKMGQNDALTTAVLVLNAEKSDDNFCAWATI